MPTPSPEHLARCNTAMLALPMALEVHMRLLEQAPGKASTRITVTPSTSQGSGHLHGTYLYALLDYTAFLAVVTGLDDDQSAATMDAHFSLLDPAPTGAQVRIEAQVERQGRHVAFLSCRAVWVGPDGTARTIALGRITKTIMSMAQRKRPRATPGADA